MYLVLQYRVNCVAVGVINELTRASVRPTAATGSIAGSQVDPGVGKMFVKIVLRLLKQKTQNVDIGR